MTRRITIAQAQGRLRRGQPGKVRNQSQRNEPEPYLNCRIWQWLTMAWWAGLRWDGGTRTAVGITELIRRKSGRPEFDANGNGQGTAAQDLERGLQAVFPWMRTSYRMVDDEELLEGLGDRFVAGVAVWLPSLPARQQRYSGSGRIGHQVGLMDGNPDTSKVRYLDPLGPGDHGGDWPHFGRIRPALMQRSDGATFCTLLEAGDPMLTIVKPVESFAGAGATGTLKPGTYRTFDVDPETRDFVRRRDVRLKSRAHITVGYVAKVEKLPRKSPTGRFYLVTDGPMAGRFIRASETTLERPVPDGDVETARAAGRVEGYAAAVAEFAPAELPDELYVREPVV